MTDSARFDEHADWYAAYVKGEARAHTVHTADALRDVLGPGEGRCIDVGCGTGIHAEMIRSLGWTPVGFDVSIAQLRHARDQLPVVLADAVRLPLRSGSIEAAAATLIHTDVPDWAAVVSEVARVLGRGGRFAYVGVHPCFVGPFAKRGVEDIRLYPGYGDRGHTYAGPGVGEGVRSRVGVHHRTLTDLLTALPAAGLTLQTMQELGSDSFPDLLSFSALKLNER